MLALIAGTGDLPTALVAALPVRPVICALDGFAPALDVDITFRIEQLGTFLAELGDRGVTQICMAGAVRRPAVDPDAIDALTQPLVPRIMAALGKGDDGALRVIIEILEEAGFQVVAAHEVAPDLLPAGGVLTKATPDDWALADAAAGQACVATMGDADLGQACVIRKAELLAKEDDAGTDAMLERLAPPAADGSPDKGPFSTVANTVGTLLGDAADWLSGGNSVDPALPARGGVLFKGPKPNQDRRADLPVIGPATAVRASAAGLSGIVIEVDGVMVLDRDAVVEILDAQGMFLWVRART